MCVSTLLADPCAIRLEKIVSGARVVTLVFRTVQPQARCPRCDSPSTSLHSHYRRRVADLPWHGVAVCLELHTRRFRCRRELCRQRIFCERIPQTVARYARRTVRLDEALTLIGFAAGGETGACLATELGIGASHDTVLRRIRRAVAPEHPTPRVLGVDDWAFRRGHRYGTILVDLERRSVVDLLPDREADSLAAWLRAHPSVEVVTRDRFRAYKEGVAAGAPQALQVADRWHVLRNMTEAFERWLNRLRRAIRQAAADAATGRELADTAAELGAASPLTTRKDQRRAERHAVHQARFDEVNELYRRGATIRGIAAKFRMHRRTVRLFINSDECPERAPPRRRPNRLDSFLPYLKRRWTEGCHNAAELWREIKTQGFTGCQSAVRQFIAAWRMSVPPELRRKRRLSSGTPPKRVTVPGTRAVTWLLLREDSDLTEWQRNFIARLCEQQPEVVTAQTLVRRFQQIVTRRDAAAFDGWVTEVNESKLPELVNFAAGLAEDAAVRAALECEWSNGQTEGHVNRLKMIKRGMYGRANLDLLRARVLHSS